MYIERQRSAFKQTWIFSVDCSTRRRTRGLPGESRDRGARPRHGGESSYSARTVGGSRRTRRRRPVAAAGRRASARALLVDRCRYVQLNFQQPVDAAAAARAVHLLLMVLLRRRQRRRREQRADHGRRRRRRCRRAQRRSTVMMMERLRSADTAADAVFRRQNFELLLTRRGRDTAVSCRRRSPPGADQSATVMSAVCVSITNMASVLHCSDE